MEQQCCLEESIVHLIIYYRDKMEYYFPCICDVFVQRSFVSTVYLKLHLKLDLVCSAAVRLCISIMHWSVVSFVRCFWELRGEKILF